MTPGLGTGNMTATTDAVFIPTIWGPKLNDFYRAKLLCANFFTDLSGEVAGGGNIVKIPNISEMTANSKTITSEVTLNAQTMGTITLTINTWKEVSFLLEDFVKSDMKKSYYMQERWMKNAGYTVANTLEAALIALFAGFSQIVGDSSHFLNDSSIRAAIAYLDTANVPVEDRAWFLHPNTFWNQVQAINKYSLATNTAGVNPVTMRPQYLLYGDPVYLTSGLAVTTGHRDGAYCGKDALAFATANIAGGEQADTVRLQTMYLQNYLGTLVTADIIFGVIENRDTSGVWVKASS
jgi:hypothetical protein